MAGKNLGGVLNLHVVSSTAEPMVHITRSRRPEIVLFGVDHPLRSPVLLFAGKHIMVQDGPHNELTVRRYASQGAEDSTEQCPARLDPLIRTLVNVGATYPDVVQVITQAAKNKSLASRVVFDAVPELGRKYYRHGDDGDEIDDGPDGQEGGQLDGEAQLESSRAAGDWSDSDAPAGPAEGSES